MKITDLQGLVTLNNGVEMPYLGLGTYRVKEGKEIADVVQHALDAGYRHIDTAAFYKNENGVGKAINKHEINRDDVFVTSKVWNADQGYDKTLRAFDESLNLFRFEYLDLYLIHWPVQGKFKHTWRALEKIYRDGKVRCIGLSNFLQHQIEDLLESAEILPVVNQMEFHPRLIQQDLIEFCKSKNIQYQSWSPFMQGGVFKIKELANIADKYNKSIAQLIIRWNLQKGVVTIPKSSNKERIISNTDVFDFAISNDDITEIDSLANKSRIGSNPDNFDF